MWTFLFAFLLHRHTSHVAFCEMSCHVSQPQVPNSFSPDLVISPVQLKDGGYYICRVNSGEDFEFSQWAHVDVLEIGMSYGEQPQWAGQVWGGGMFDTGQIWKLYLDDNNQNVVTIILVWFWWNLEGWRIGQQGVIFGGQHVTYCSLLTSFSCRNQSPNPCSVSPILYPRSNPRFTIDLHQ